MGDDVVATNLVRVSTERVRCVVQLGVAQAH